MRLRSFDAFPKLEKSYAEQNGPNSPALYAFFIFALLFLYLETSYRMSTGVKYHFDVDRGVSDQFLISLAIDVKAKCKDVGIYIEDVSDDRLFVNELVQTARSFHEPENPEAEWCHIAGSFETNRVRGRLTISSKLGPFAGNFNATHYVSHLGFGELPELMARTFQPVFLPEPAMHAYFISIVPTRVQTLGIEIDTNQYTLREQTKKLTSTYLSPAVSFDYDFDPIMVTVWEDRMSFFAWLMRVVNIVGGLVFAGRGLRRILHSKKAPTSQGLLDHVEEKN